MKFSAHKFLIRKNEDRALPGHVKEKKCFHLPVGLLARTFAKSLNCGSKVYKAAFMGFRSAPNTIPRSQILDRLLSFGGTILDSSMVAFLLHQ